jgi:septum formation protein
MGTDFVYLASASPRRADLLRQIGVPFEVRPARLPEARRAAERPETYVQRLAQAKADAIWDELRAAPRAPVLAADTAVVLEDRVLGKPADRVEALAMLAALSGRTHRVLTAVALRCQDDRRTLLSENEVRFRTLSEHDCVAYCAGDEPYDKAGGYGIQGRAAVFIEHLSGSYSAVMGLPLAETAALLSRYGMPAWLSAHDGRA